MSRKTRLYYCFQCTEWAVLILRYCRWPWHCWITIKWSKSLIETCDLSFVSLYLWQSPLGFYKSCPVELLFTLDLLKGCVCVFICMYYICLYCCWCCNGICEWMITVQNSIQRTKYLMLMSWLWSCVGSILFRPQRVMSAVFLPDLRIKCEWNTFPFSPTLYSVLAVTVCTCGWNRPVQRVNSNCGVLSWWERGWSVRSVRVTPCQSQTAVVAMA